jgi:hypothetical protein
VITTDALDRARLTTPETAVDAPSGGNRATSARFAPLDLGALLQE